MTLEPLGPDRVDAYLRRLGAPRVSHDVAGLAALQSAHLTSVPFHNLLLLANDGREHALPAIEQVADAAIAGVGGNCDRTTPPFAALLRALDFDAHLAAATVREPGDHFVSVVTMNGARYVCDVGNGHPYMRPWSLDAGAQEQSVPGWRFRFDPHGADGPTLERHLGADAWKVVYVVDPTPRSYASFAPIVDAHYTRPAFGPFLTGLRAALVGPGVVLTLRDNEYVRDSRFGRSLRRVRGRDGVAALLVERFGLDTALVDRALEVVGRKRPDLFAEEPRWFALGRGTIDQSVGVEPPSREEVPDIFVSLAACGRASAVNRLVRTLSDEVRASRYPGRVGVLIVENSECGGAAVPEVSAAPGVAVHRVPLSSVRDHLDRCAHAGILPALGPLPASIGAAREAQLAAIRAHLAEPIPGLPHPALHPTAFWLVDDDVAFEQLDESGAVSRRTHLLFRVARFWAASPQHAVVLGSFTGDPPVPALDALGGQLDDLAANVMRMIELGPDASWQPPPTPPPTFDAYYDLTEAAPPRDGDVWPYAPRERGRVRDVALALLADVPRLVHGHELTRPLIWDGSDVAPAPSVRRGGNALFLDLDALFRWPTPVLGCGDGVVTRRADTLWAALAQADDPGAVVEATLPLLHDRSHQGRSDAGGELSPAVASAAQVRGVALARALAGGREVASELAAREVRVGEHRAALRPKLARLTTLVADLAQWSDAAICVAIPGALDILLELDQLIVRAAPVRGDPRELEAFLARLPEAVRAWRAAW